MHWLYPYGASIHSMNITIHCTRQQIALLAASLGKFHLERDGTKTLVVPEWIEKMYQAAKVYDFIIKFREQKGRMRVYHSIK